MGEHSGMLPGFLPPACNQRDACEQGRSIRFKRRFVGPDKPQGEEGRTTEWKSY